MIRELIERSSALDEHKTNYKVATKVLSFDGACRLIIPQGPFKMKFELTDWAMSQLCQKLGPPPFRYIQKCPKHIAAINLDYWRSRVNKTWLLRSYDDKCRAVLDEHYTPISNTEILTMVETSLGNTPYDQGRPHLDADTLHLKVTMATSSDGNYGIGAYIGNGEIGNRMLRVMPYIQRTTCQNSIMFSRGAFEHKHYRVSRAFLAGAVQDKLGYAFKIATERLEELVRSEMQGIPKVADMVKSICKSKGLAQHTHDKILMGMEGSETLFGVINGLTFAAKELPVEDRIDLETYAGSLLEDRRWRTRQ